MSTFTLAISYSTTSNLPWFPELTFQVPVQYCCFISINSHIHKWVLFLLWLFLFIISGVNSPLISSSILGTYQPGEFIFQFPIFLLFMMFMGLSRQEYWSDLAFPSPVDYFLLELSTITCLSWVALHCMAYSFIEFDKAVVHVIRLVSFLWLWFPPVLDKLWRLVRGTLEDKF